MNFLSLLEAKRDGHALDPQHLAQVISAYTKGRIPDYQMAAFLMAVFFRGLSGEETMALTMAMRDSGEVLDWHGRDRRPVVDKHSTGGVGDKVSLPLAPLLACLGFRVPMISGRGLGITGGTLDKLESIPGFQTLLPAERMREIVEEVGCVICGQTAGIVPADKGLYALRDVTGTVPSIPLIVASIMSKKLAEGLDALVLDVKFGAAAFMSTEDQARQLARAMVDLGNALGVNTHALLSRMDTPLGRAAGNWLEVVETLECLGYRPAQSGKVDDLRSLVVTCAAHLQIQTGRAATLKEAAARAEQCLRSGEALAKWNQMLSAQGANLEAFYELAQRDSAAPAGATADVIATRPGFVTRCDAKIIGEVIRDIGGGRLTKDSTINHAMGVDRMLKPGDQVAAGAVLARVHAADRATAAKAVTRLETAFAIADAAPDFLPLISGVESGGPDKSLS